jgi:hypothetical protein
MATDPELERLYRRERSIGLTAEQAWHAAKVRRRFAQLDGQVRLDIQPEQSMTLEDLVGEGATKAQLDEIRARAESEGVWVVVAQVHVSYPDGHERWEPVDSTGGFVGDDWKDSGYDIELMQSAIDAHEKREKALGPKLDAGELRSALADVLEKHGEAIAANWRNAPLGERAAAWQAFEDARALLESELDAFDGARKVGKP